MTEAPPTRCPLVHVPAVRRVDVAALTPVVAFLRDEAAARRTERFEVGTAQRDGRLDFCKQGLGPEGLSRVLGAMGAHAWLRHLLLGTNGLGDEGVSVLADALRGGTRLETLYLGCNAIRAPGVARLAAALDGDESVRALWLKRNPIGPDGLGPLLDVLPRTRIRTLDLTNCELGDEGCRQVIEALPGTGVEHLYLGSNGLRDPEPLARRLRDPACRMQSVFLGSSRLGDDGARALGDALGHDDARLASLDVASNGLTVDGLIALTRPGRLSWLNFGASPASAALGEADNHLDDGDVPALIELARAPLRWLGLRETALTSAGAKALLAGSAEGTAPASVILGRGVARRLRRALRDLGGERAPRPPDVARIASVYR